METWYKKLLVYSLLMGVAGGIGALLFTVITTEGSHFLFGDMSPETWSGSIYWIPLTALGALLVAYLRKRMSVPKKVPGAVQLAKDAWVEPNGAIQLIIIAVLTIIFGASLGPSFGIVIIGGAFASWLVMRIGRKYGKEEKKEYARTGMAAGLGAVFSAPILATLLVQELSPSTKPYNMSIIPKLVSSSLGYIIFFGVTGAVFMNSYTLPDYTYENSHLFYGVILGFLSIAFLLAYQGITVVTGKLMNLLKNNYVKALVGGAAVGFITFALPLTFGSGNSQLSIVTENYTAFSVGLLVMMFIAKTAAIKFSQDSGFIGGNVFPIIFVSGLAGIIISSVFTFIPIGLSVGAVMASLPGAALSAPISLILIAVGGIGLSPTALPAITIAVAIAQVSMFVIKRYVSADQS